MVRSNFEGLIPHPSCHREFPFREVQPRADPADPLLHLTEVIPWQDFEQTFSKHYTQGLGAPSKPIRLLMGLLLLKQLENLSDETVVVQWKRNPYYQSFVA